MKQKVKKILKFGQVFGAMSLIVSVIPFSIINKTIETKNLEINKRNISDLANLKYENFSNEEIKRAISNTSFKNDVFSFDFNLKEISERQTLNLERDKYSLQLLFKGNSKASLVLLKNNIKENELEIDIFYDQIEKEVKIKYNGQIFDSKMQIKENTFVFVIPFLPLLFKAAAAAVATIATVVVANEVAPIVANGVNNMFQSSSSAVAASPYVESKKTNLSLTKEGINSWDISAVLAAEKVIADKSKKDKYYLSYFYENLVYINFLNPFGIETAADIVNAMPWKNNKLNRNSLSNLIPGYREMPIFNKSWVSVDIFAFEESDILQLLTRVKNKYGLVRTGKEIHELKEKTPIQFWHYHVQDASQKLRKAGHLAFGIPQTRIFK